VPKRNKANRELKIQHFINRNLWFIHLTQYC